MSASTTLTLQDKIPLEQILPLLKTIDSKAYRHSRYLHFTYEGEERMLYYYTPYLSLSYGLDSIAIMKLIAKEFGGWLTENDCDEDKEPYHIEKSTGITAIVRKVTLQEVYDKFGEIVIIKDS